MIWGSISPTRRDKSPPRQVGSIWDGLPGVLSNGLHQHTAGQVLFRSSKAFPPPKKSDPSWGTCFFWGKWSRYHGFLFFQFYLGGWCMCKTKSCCTFWYLLEGKMKCTIKLNEGRQWKTHVFIIFNYQEMLHLHLSLDCVVLRWDGQSGWDPSQTNGIKRPRTHKTYWSCQVLAGASVKGLFWKSIHAIFRCSTFFFSPVAGRRWLQPFRFWRTPLWGVCPSWVPCADMLDTSRYAIDSLI